MITKLIKELEGCQQDYLKENCIFVHKKIIKIEHIMKIKFLLDSNNQFSNLEYYLKKIQEVVEGNIGVFELRKDIAYK